jgi:hypothetical protein
MSNSRRSVVAVNRADSNSVELDDVSSPSNSSVNTPNTPQQEKKPLTTNSDSGNAESQPKEDAEKKKKKPIHKKAFKAVKGIMDMYGESIVCVHCIFCVFFYTNTLWLDWTWSKKEDLDWSTYFYSLAFGNSSCHCIQYLSIGSSTTY